jgi:hypothetical protein
LCTSLFLRAWPTLPAMNLDNSNNILLKIQEFKEEFVRLKNEINIVRTKMMTTIQSDLNEIKTIKTYILSSDLLYDSIITYVM